MDVDDAQLKRRRVVIADDEEDVDSVADGKSVGSNPDEDYDDGDALEEEGDGEDLMENIYE